jgi:hypothetical protein
MRSGTPRVLDPDGRRKLNWRIRLVAERGCDSLFLSERVDNRLNSAIAATVAGFKFAEQCILHFAESFVAFSQPGK